MVDLSAIAAGLSAVEHGLSVLRAVRSNDFEYEKSELKLQVAEVTTSLADAKVALTEARDRITSLEEEVARLRAFRERKFRNHHGLYVEVDREDRLVDGPFCSRCADVDKRSIRVLPDRRTGPRHGFCPECKAFYEWYNLAKEAIDDGRALEEGTGA